MELSSDYTKGRLSRSNISYQTDLDFFTNLPDNIEKTIEEKEDDGLMSASLLAQADDLFSEANLNIENAQHTNTQEIINLEASKVNSDPLSIFENSSFNHRPIEANPNKVSVSEINVQQVSIIEDTSSTISPAKISETQIGEQETDITHIGIPKISISENSMTNLAIPRVSIVSSITPTEIGSFEVNSTEIGSIQINSSQLSFTQIDPIQVNSSKVTLPISISLQQFLSSHFPTHNLTSG